MPPDDAAARSSQANLRRPCDLAGQAQDCGLWMSSQRDARSWGCCRAASKLPCTSSMFEGCYAQCNELPASLAVCTNEPIHLICPVAGLHASQLMQ